LSATLDEPAGLVLQNDDHGRPAADDEQTADDQAEEDDNNDAAAGDEADHLAAVEPAAGRNSTATSRAGCQPPSSKQLGCSPARRGRSSRYHH
jgi:hypothetical protein